jgi:Mg2+ and Co2+ transporter CorA
MQIENFAKVMNFIQTIMNRLGKIVNTVVNEAFLPLLQIVVSIADAIAPLLQDFAERIGNVIERLYPVLKLIVELLNDLVIPVVMALVSALWPLVDVIVSIIELLYPIIQSVGNAIIDVVNGILVIVNGVLSLVGAKQIEYLSYLGDMEDAIVDYTDEIQAQQSKLQTVQEEIDWVINQLKDLYNKDVSSLQDLYEVGAVSATEYEQAIDELNEEYQSVLEDSIPEGLRNIWDALVGDKDSLKNKLEELRKQEKNIEEAITQLKNYQGSGPKEDTTKAKPSEPTGAQMIAYSEDVRDAVFSRDLAESLRLKLMSPADIAATYARGTSLVPTDMMANIHRGEMIIPKDFADSIRQGELSLNGGSNGGGGDVYVIVKGSVIAERDLLDAIARGTERGKRRGYVNV